MRIAQRVAVGLAVAMLVVLVVTGIWLWFNYRPGELAWSDPLVTDAQEGAGRVRLIHRAASLLLIYDLLVLAALVIFDRLARPRWPAAVGSFVLGVAFMFTGLLLPWDQLALKAVTVGTNIRGVSGAFGNDVVFVLIGSSEVSTSVYRWWAVVHGFVLPAAALLIPILLLLARRREGAAESSGL